MCGEAELRSGTTTEGVQEFFAVRSSVTSAGAPAFACAVTAVITLCDWMERGRTALREVVESGVEVAATCAEGLIAAGNECGPERYDGAGSGSSAGGASNEEFGTVSGIGWAGDVGHTAAWLASRIERNFGVLLP